MKKMARKHLDQKPKTNLVAGSASLIPLQIVIFTFKGRRVIKLLSKYREMGVLLKSIIKEASSNVQHDEENHLSSFLPSFHRVKNLFYLTVPQ